MQVGIVKFELRGDGLWDRPDGSCTRGQGCGTGAERLFAAHQQADGAAWVGWDRGDGVLDVGIVLPGVAVQVLDQWEMQPDGLGLGANDTTWGQRVVQVLVKVGTKQGAGGTICHVMATHVRVRVSSVSVAAWSPCACARACVCECMCTCVCVSSDHCMGATRRTRIRRITNDHVERLFDFRPPHEFGSIAAIDRQALVAPCGCNGREILGRHVHDHLQ
jgi:hypothetical protein